MNAKYFGKKTIFSRIHQRGRITNVDCGVEVRRFVVAEGRAGWGGVKTILKSDLINITLL